MPSAWPESTVTTDAAETATSGGRLPEGLSIQVRVPASSANLGPGFDCLGIALGVYDEVTVVTVPGGDIEVEVDGEGAGDVPRDGSHLVARALTRGLEYAGISAPGLKLHCRNDIPHSRGLGSSAAAAVSGLAAASGLISASGIGDGLSADELVQLSSEFEGHPDNAAASVYGSAVVTWTADTADAPRYQARRLQVHPDIGATVFVPDTESSTSFTRGLLPDTVPRADAIFNLSRSALAVVALTADPTCLMAASDDRLHQPYRAAAMAPTAELVAKLRAHGFAATVSGAGPSVLVLSMRPVPGEIRELAAASGFTPRTVEVAGGVEVTVS
ncbi:MULTISPECIES: homoserine kinase [unclassified Gordonia (in: high G+C Gram-positive bacteria)]|uniref:homoserine kinase n=1 Tax=unclassified Gordonia (in: high G+C Gram-positive bacteria) TaxID=2657482 RepID=UPI001F0F928F|nr:homoserine kinase [Gordonia sp. ABSL49_1]MCH5644355.1 homoserine kinase [Gordonia sp. ABSL49_1]